MAATALRTDPRPRMAIAPGILLTGAMFVLCFGFAFWDLIDAWLNNPDATHGLLIAPVTVWLAWRTGIVANAKPAVWTGISILTIGIILYVLGRTVGVSTVSRGALVIALVGMTVWAAGWRQVIAWWLSFVLFILTIPIPESLIGAITLPLQGIAAQLGAELLSWRNIPVLLSGNIIRLPGHALFVSEACSGLRSLTALVSMAILIGALFLRHPVTRVLMLVTAVMLAVLVNGVRVFLTGFLVFFIDPKLGEGFMHLSEGYLLFIVSLSILAGVTWVYRRAEDRFVPSRVAAQ